MSITFPNYGVSVEGDAADHLDPPGDLSTIDIRSAWFEEDVDATGTFTGFTVYLRIWGDVNEATPGTRYEVRWRPVVGCPAFVAFEVGSGATGSHDCGTRIGGGGYPPEFYAGCSCEPFAVAAHEIAGDEIRWSVRFADLESDSGVHRYYPGVRLSEIRAVTRTRGHGVVTVNDSATANRDAVIGTSSDLTPPELGFATADDAELYRWEQLSGWALDGDSGMAHVQVRWRAQWGSPTTSTGNAKLDCTPDRRSCSWSVGLTNRNPGPYEVTATAIDLAGNASAESSITVFVL